MKKKEIIKIRYNVLKGNPDRKERLEALFDNKIIKVTDSGTIYHKLDKYQRLTFSYTGHPDSFQPYYQGYDYTNILDDYNDASNTDRKIEILDSL